MKKTCRNHYAPVSLGIGQKLCILTLLTLLAITGWIYTPWQATASDFRTMEPRFAPHFAATQPLATQQPNAILDPVEAIFQQITNEQWNDDMYMDWWTIDEVPQIYEYEHRSADMARRHLQLLHTLDKSTLTTEQQIAYKTMEFVLQNQAESDLYTPYRYLATHTDMTMIYLPYQFIEVQAWGIQTLADAERMLKRIQQFGKFYHQLRTELKNREQIHVIPPAYILDRMYIETKNFANLLKKNPIYYAFEFSVNNLLQDVDENTKRQLCERALEMTTDEKFIEAYEELALYFLELKEKTDTIAGIWQLPYGDASYAQTLRSYTSSNLTPDEIHNLGLQEVAAIQAELRVLLDEMGYQGIGLSEALQLIDEKTRLTGTDLIVRTYQGYIEEMRGQLGNLFEKIPTNLKVNMRITYEGTYPASAGGNNFYVDLTFPHSTYSMRSTAYHEAIPGHIFMRAYQLQFKTGVLSDLFYVTAFQEGWALYTESLGYEIGMLKEQESIVGYLQGRLWRAARLVVDTGLHAKRWTREQAIHYFTATTGLAKYAESEVERYISWPGQACTYLIGELKFMELRDKAKTALGDKFDLKKFHHAVLTYGSLSMEALELAVDNYIANNL